MNNLVELELVVGEEPEPGVEVPLSDLPDLSPSEIKLLLRMRPKKRRDCVNGPRPCPWYSCRHHLGIDVSPSTGRITMHIDPDELDESCHTCALDIADQGGMILEDLGAILGISRERTRQIEERGLARVAARLPVDRQPRRSVQRQVRTTFSETVPEGYIPLDEAAARMGRSPENVRYHCYSGRIAHALVSVDDRRLTAVRWADVEQCYAVVRRGGNRRKPALPYRSNPCDK